jgi:hypothetical protein
MVIGYPSYSGGIQLIYDGLPLSTRFNKNKITRNIQQTIDAYLGSNMGQLKSTFSCKYTLPHLVDAFPMHSTNR